MTSDELLQLAARVDLNPKELAHLLGIAERTILRGVQDGGIIDILARDIAAGLDDPAQHLSVRAAVIMAARSDGLKTYLRGMRRAYVETDLRAGPEPRTIVR